MNFIDIGELKELKMKDIEEIEKRIKTKIKIIEMNYNKYFVLDIGYNMMLATVHLSYDNPKEKLKAIEEYIDRRLKDFLDNKSIIQNSIE